MGDGYKFEIEYVDKNKQTHIVDWSGDLFQTDYVKSMITALKSFKKCKKDCEVMLIKRAYHIPIEQPYYKLVKNLYLAWFNLLFIFLEMGFPCLIY